MLTFQPLVARFLLGADQPLTIPEGELWVSRHDLRNEGPRRAEAGLEVHQVLAVLLGEMTEVIQLGQHEGNGRQNEDYLPRFRQGFRKRHSIRLVRVEARDSVQ